jgi:hypothetical protein
VAIPSRTAFQNASPISIGSGQEDQIPPSGQFCKNIVVPAVTEQPGGGIWISAIFLRKFGLL